MTSSVESIQATLPPVTVEGRHWLLDLSDCRCDLRLLCERAPLESLCLQACSAAGLTVVGSAFHQFTPSGVTGVVLLAESHLSVRTWPDERFAAVDVYVCNHRMDNSEKGARLSRSLTALFEAVQPLHREVCRTSVSAAPGGLAHDG